MSNNLSTEKSTYQSDIEVFAQKTKEFTMHLATKVKTYVFPNIIKLLYKLNILKDIDEELTKDEDLENEYTLKIVNASNQAKQVALLDMAVFTSPEIQNCIINQNTLKETVIEFQVVKNRLYIENRSSKGNFLYEGALAEQVYNNISEMTPILKKVFIDFFVQEVYQYHCSSFLDISFEDLFDEKWMNKICSKLSDFDDEEVLNSQYPKKVLNKFKFIYMLIKTQEIKYEAFTKTKSQS